MKTLLVVLTVVGTAMQLGPLGFGAISAKRKWIEARNSLLQNAPRRRATYADVANLHDVVDEAITANEWKGLRLGLWAIAGGATISAVASIWSLYLPS